MLRVVLLCCLCSPISRQLEAVPPQEDGEMTLDRILNSSAEKYRSIDGFSCPFRQVVDIPLLEKRKEFSGTLFYRSPDLLKLDYEDPAGGYILCDGECFYVYLPEVDSTRVMKTDLGNDPRFFLTEFFIREAERDYEATLAGSDEERYTLRFLPRETRADLVRIDLFITRETGMIQSVSYVDPSGSTTSYYLADPALTAEPEKFFQFVQPEGTELLDLTSGSR